MYDTSNDQIDNFMEWLKDNVENSNVIKKDFEKFSVMSYEERRKVIIQYIRNDYKYNFSSYCNISHSIVPARFDFREFFIE